MASEMAGYQLFKRKKNGKELGPWQLRVFVPKSLQGRVGKSEVFRSLGTADRRLADRRVHATLTEIESGWNLPADGGAELSNDPAALGVKIGYDGMLATLEDRRRAWPADDAEYEARIAKREADLRRLARRVQDGDMATFEAIADRAIAKRGVSIAKGSERYSELVSVIADASVDALSVFTRRAAGELDAEPRTAIVREAKAKAAAKAKSGEMLLEFFEAWGAEMLAKGEKRPDTVNQDRKVIEQFAAFVGSDRAIDSITPREVAAYRETLRELPPKWTMKRELRNLDMRAAAVKARELNLPRTAFTTVNKHLSTISPLYKWVAGKPEWAGLQNPCNGLFHAKVKGKNRRPAFSTAQLNTILQSPLFTGFQGDGKEHLPGNQRADDWRFWIPIIAMFTGARIGEVAQLRVGDVRRERGVWFVHIRHEERDGLTTKSGKSRIAAAHPTLLRIGLLAFHQRQLERAGGDETAPLFPELAPNARGQISGTPSAWWRDYLAAIGVKDSAVEGGDGFGSHSFRHTLSDRLRSEAELLDNEVAVCLGHNQKTTTSGYGTLSQGTVTRFKSWMDAVTFEGVDFSHLLESALAAAE